ncbi:MAG: hypothetical protein U1F00_08790 [Rhodoferax sp.]
MATLSPFHLVERLAQQVLTRLPPPPWAVEEIQRRIVLLLNHVLMQEPAAMERLVRQKTRVVALRWQNFALSLRITPAGLLDLAPPDANPDLALTLEDGYAADMAQALLRGDKPAVRIDGDVQLAAEVNWLADNVRWDIEEDLARVIGDAPAHHLGQIVRRVREVIRRFPGTGRPVPAGASGSAP